MLGQRLSNINHPPESHWEKGKRTHSSRYPELTVTVIHAREKDKPKGRDPIDWKLVTDMPVRTRTEAIEKLRSEEHTSELQSIMRISYAVFCLKKKKKTKQRQQKI